MLNRLNLFFKTKQVIESDLDPEEKVERMKNMNNTYQEKPSKFQRILDFLAQPVYVGKGGVEEAKALAIMQRGYWEAIAERDRRDRISEPDKHLHIHLHDMSEEKAQRVLSRVQNEKLAYRDN